MLTRSSLNIVLLSLLLTVTLLLVAPQSFVEGRRWTRDEDEDKKLLGRMVDAVELGTEFFSSDFSGVNLDGLFGIRLGQGQITEALRECKSSGSCPLQLQRRLLTLNEEIEVTAKTALGYVEIKDPDYFQRFLPTVNQPYRTQYVPVRFTDLDTMKAGSDDRYNEEDGDMCYSRLFGTYEENGKAVQRCNVTDKCWDMMTQTNLAKYSLTHQLLYFILSEKEGCVRVMEHSMQSNIRDTEAWLCGLIYNEARAEVRDGAVVDISQDLFLEQVSLCGVLGFEDFLRPDWMKMVLTWQKPSGCFSVDDPGVLQAEAMMSELQEEERQVLQDLQREERMMQSQHGGRKLLREQMMNDGCLSHKSGLGFANLCLYIRYLIRQIYLN